MCNKVYCESLLIFVQSQLLLAERALLGDYQCRIKSLKTQDYHSRIKSLKTQYFIASRSVVQ